MLAAGNSSKYSAKKDMTKNMPSSYNVDSIKPSNVFKSGTQEVVDDNEAMYLDDISLDDDLNPNMAENI